jgi:hypothetical protein
MEECRRVGTVALTEGNRLRSGVTAPVGLIIALARKSTDIRRVRNPGLPHHQEFVLVEDVCVVVESCGVPNSPQVGDLRFRRPYVIMT